MFEVLAVDIDVVSLSAMVISAVTIASGALATFWVGVKKLAVYFWNYAEPKITHVYQEHIGVVSDMRASVPAVRDAIQSLDASQKAQCEQLERLTAASDRHEELHEQTGRKLEEILAVVRQPSGESI